MIILGLSGALGHDASAALLIDGNIVAAAEEERFIRDKHAKNRMPLESARFCLNDAGVDPRQVDLVAFPYAPIPITRPDRWHYARRYWYAPDRSLDALLNGNRRFRRNRQRVLEAGRAIGIDWQHAEFVPVEHHLAHASSAYHLSGFKEKTAILGVDGKGEYATTFFGYGENGQIHKLKEFFDPDSLSGVYGAITEYLGFEMLDGEYKVMGMAPYGDPQRYDRSRLIAPSGKGFAVATDLVNTVGLRRHKDKGTGYYFSDKLIDWLGPKREGDIADEPYIHYAAAMQQLFEDWCLRLLDTYLGETLKETGRLAFAGGGALNVKLNQRIVDLPYVQELYVQPASGDSGTALGAATYVAKQRGETLGAMTHVYLGPQYCNERCLESIEGRREPLEYRKIDDVPATTAKILADGNPVAWFQGRMEFGPRALGARSILGCPNSPGIADRINEQIKFRERWRPFCPSVIDTQAADIIQTEHPAPFMTITFSVAPQWKERIPEVVHEDGTARVQIVSADQNPRYYALLQQMQERTGNGVVLNTSLNRRGEPMVCSPDDALNMFFGSDLEYLMMEDYLVTKPGVAAPAA
ncbi:MAG: carbamoyltransferase family protein [Pseudomonadales bacterium]